MKRDLRRAILTSGFCLLLFLGIVLLQNRAPLIFMYLVAEDWYGEYATCVAYLTACGLLIAGMNIAPHLRTYGHFVMALGFFFIGMEEISWAQRLVGIRTPHVVAQVNYQSEINLHNTVNVEFMTIFCYGLIVWMFLVPLLRSRNGKVARWLAAFGIPDITLAQTPPFVLAVIILLFDPLVNGEVGELVLGLAFVYWAAETYLKARGERRRRVSSLAFAACLVVLITGLTAVLVVVGGDLNSYRRRLRHSAIVAYPSHGYNDQAATLFKHMINEPPNPIYQDALFEYGLFLKRTQSPEADAVLERFLHERYRLTSGSHVLPDDHRRAGVAFKLLNDQENAAQAFRRALDIDVQRLERAQKQSERSPAMFSMARTYFELGEFRLALKHANDARELAQSSRDRLRIQEWVESIERGPVQLIR